MSTNPPKSLMRAAQRAIKNDFFLAGILHEHQQANHLNDEELACFLECDRNDLPRLALCRRPDAQQEAFLSDIEHLARRFHLHADRLAAVIRQVDTLRMLQRRQRSSSHEAAQDLLQAARDRDDTFPKGTEDTL